MNERDRQARECQREEEPEPAGGALPADALQERRQRNVDREGAHHVIEAPLGEAWLESVVTADATLLVRNRRVDGAEHELAIDVQQLRPGFCVRGRCKGLDGL